MLNMHNQSVSFSAYIYIIFSDMMINDDVLKMWLRLKTNR